MANIKSAKKRIKTNERNRVRNQSYKTRMKTFLKKAITAIETNAEDKAAVVKATLTIIDKTASKGVIHKKTAARKKSALALALNNSLKG